MLRRRPKEPGLDRERYRSSLAWGFVDQGFSSATNFGLSILAGRLLGPAGLGTVFLAFTVYLLTAGVQRQLLIEPLVAESSGKDEHHRRTTASLGLTIAIGAALLASCTVAGLGWLLPGVIGDALLLIAPWLPAVLVQDYWRHILFRDARAPRAAANDGVWLLAMAIAVPACVLISTEWAVIGTWAIGALAGALLGFAQTGVRLAGPGAAFRWWSRDVWPFGRWNAGAGLISNIASQSNAFIVSLIVGASALGGLRAAESVFAPLTLVGPAIALPGLPAVTRAYARSPTLGRSLALRLSAVALVAATAYISMMIAGGWRLLPLLFGPEFLSYRELIWPLAAGQLCLAIGIGFLLLIKSQRRGRVLFLNRVVAGVTGVAMVALLAATLGVIGAAWGTAAASFASTLFLAIAVLRLERAPAVVAGRNGEAIDPRARP